PASVTYAGRSGCCAGLDQIAFQVPDSPRGCTVPIAVRTEGRTISNFVSIPISAAGQSCSDLAPGIPTPLLTRAIAGEPLKYGVLAVGPVSFLKYIGFSFPRAITANLSQILQRPVSETDVRRLMIAYRTKRFTRMKQLMTKYGISSKYL